MRARPKSLSALMLAAITLPVSACQLCSVAGVNLLHTSGPVQSGELLYEPPSEPLGAPLSVPAYNSLPGAHAKIYLDFDGDTTSNWGGYVPGTTPAYDSDGDTSSFSALELGAIEETWKRVSEKYSPFNINVTTVPPGNLNDKETVHVVIGGSGSWFGPAGGVAWPGGFYNSFPNKVFVFEDLLLSVPKYIGEAAAHEAGHTFGLNHQSKYDPVTNAKLSEYNDYDGVTKAPVMGKSYHTARGLWWKGPTQSGYNVIEDNLQVLTSFVNGFGYRTDDHGNTRFAATPLSIDGQGNLFGAGIIAQTSDLDYFSFSTLGGAFDMSVSPAEFGGMLDASVFLYDSTGLMLAMAATASLGESITGYLNAGDYYLAVGSAGTYGDIGQFTVSGVISQALVPEPAAAMLLALAPLLRRRRRDGSSTFLLKCRPRGRHGQSACEV